MRDRCSTLHHRASQAAAVSITNVNAMSLPGSRDTAGAGSSRNNPYRDDVQLESFDVVLPDSGGLLNFSRSAGNIRLGTDARVRTGLNAVNAEFGDLDDGTDGNANPFVKAGLVPTGQLPIQSFRESTDPSIQNRAIAAAINTYSINEGIDGEGSSYSLDFYFEVGVVDNDAAVDSSPEFLIFERGINSGVIVEAIVGGTFDDPIYSGTSLTITANDFSPTGIFIDTVEINSGQQLGAVGIDLTDIIGSDQPAFGLRVTSLGNSGADISGIFVTGDSQQQFVENPVTAVPEPKSIWLFAFVLAFWIRRRTR